jgi:hypothetical protein
VIDEESRKRVLQLVTGIKFSQDTKIKWVPREGHCNN